MPAPTTTDMIELGEAVASDLSRGVYNQAVNVVRKWDTDVKLEDLETCLITVSCKGQTSEPDSRESLKVITQISIAVRKKLDFAKTTEEREADIDALSAILDQVTYFHTFGSPTGQPHQWAGSELVVLFPLNEARQIDSFLGVCEITFETSREVVPPEVTP